MNIGIDIDDTISETFETLLPYSQKYTIEDLKREPKINLRGDCKNHFYIENASGWTKEEAIGYWKKYYPEIMKTVGVKKFAADAINKLKQEGHKIYLITARWDMPNANIPGITKKWLEENKVEYDKLCLNAIDKLQLVKENNIDIFIDDSYENCKNIADNSNVKVLLMNSRMNEDLSYDKIQRVFSWPQIYNILGKEGEI